MIASDSRGALMQSGLNLIGQALSIFDADLRLAVANRQYQALFDLPDNLTRPGAFFEDTIRFLVLRGEYLHLSRSLTAMIATLGGLYEGVPRWRAGADLLIAINTFPARALKDYLRGVHADRLQATVPRSAHPPVRVAT